MKKLLFLSCLILISCSKPTKNNFWVNRDVFIHLISCPVNDTSKFNMQFPLDGITNEEMINHMRVNNYEAWFRTKDTVWILNEKVRGTLKQYYVIIQDSAFVISRESSKLNNYTQ